MYKRQVLRKLGLRRSGEKWISRAEFKSELGFVRHGKRWVKAKVLEFEELAEELESANLTNLILRARTDRDYRSLAKGGNVEQGMTRREVALAYGYPDRVRRKPSGRFVLDQWDYGSERVYFVNGNVFQLIGDEEEDDASSTE